MKTYISSIIPRIQKYSKKLDDLTLLTGQQWTLINDETNDKTVYIFKEDNRLLISHNGKITKATWEYLGDNSLMIDKEDESYLFRQGFFDDKVMALQLDNSQEYVFFCNLPKLKKMLKSSGEITKYLENKYLKDSDNEEGKSNKPNTSKTSEYSSNDVYLPLILVAVFFALLLLMLYFIKSL